mgnify:FL=1
MSQRPTSQTSWVSTGDPETVDDSPSKLFAPDQVGKYVTIKQPGPAGTPGAEEYREKTYRYVRTDSTMTTAPYKGALAWWSNRITFLVTTNPATLGQGRVAGVFQSAPTLGNYCYIQTAGPATVKFIDAPTAAPTVAGLFVIPSSTAGKADCLGAGTGATYPSIGVSASALNLGNNTGIVDLNISDIP